MSLITSPDVSAFTDRVVESACAMSFSRLARLSLTLRPAHSPSHLVTFYIEGFSHFVISMTASIASGWSKSCRVGLSPTGKRRLSTAHTPCRHRSQISGWQFFDAKQTFTHDIVDELSHFYILASVSSIRGTTATPGEKSSARL